MQPSRDDHHCITDRVLPVAQLVLDDPAALHAGHRVLDPHFLACNAAIFFLLCIGECATTRVLCRLLDRDIPEREPLETHILIQHTAGWQYVLFIIDQ